MRTTFKNCLVTALASIALCATPALAEGIDEVADDLPAQDTVAVEVAQETVEEDEIDLVPADADVPEPAKAPASEEPAPEEPVTHENGWEYADGATYYWLDGEKVTGWLELDGNRFYLDPVDGHLYAGGIFEVDGESYYFRPAGSPWGPEGSMGKGWVRGYGDPAADYFFDRTTGRMVTGEALVDGRPCLFGADGAAAEGWVERDGFSFCYSGGTMLSGGIFEVDGESYYFRPAGSSWGPEGSRGTGWVTNHDGNTFFFDRSDGHMLSDGIHEVDGAKYFFRGAGNPWGPEGSMGRGWVRGYGDPAEDYFFDRTTGRMAKGRAKVDGATYLFGDDGAMQTGWATIDGCTFFFGETDGKMYAGGIFEVDGESYYFRPAGSSWGPEGSRGTGWVTNYNGNTFFFDRSTGAMLSDGIFEVDGAKYFFRGAGNPWGPEGSMGRGWVRGYGDPAEDYFFDRSTGKLVESGWLRDFDTWYYISPETGEYLSNGIFPIDGQSYYFRPTGVMGRGWLRGYGSPAADYFFDRKDGHMYKNGFFIIDDTPYKADSNGKMVKQPSKYPSMLSKAQGYSSSTNYLILINCADNVICVYRGSYGNWVPVKESLCSTGAPATYTPSGIYYSGAQGYSFSGDGHTCYYYTQIYGDVLIHSILYHEYTFNVMDGRLGLHISGGCVRCPLDVAKWIYDNVPYYTTIVVYR